ncbi:hypothetical protein HHK36_024839 [Tetracentron sinense]|uniref:Retrotransposon Copia-like N-terminal domain-containing protein n=1 Tax=Tetracentron sinense TaxID=13715 RepID=A0A834YJP6_TETSI|nr:hypothetical protein HHK36_024839 [Tetracentron sinense]
MILVPKVLDGTNYAMWKRSMLISLSAKNKLGFIKGTITTPDEKDPKYSLWQRCNDMVSLGYSILSVKTLYTVFSMLKLPQKFGQIFKNDSLKIMLMNHLPTVKKAYSLLCEEEKQRGLTETKSSDLIHAMSIHTYDNSKESQLVASRQQKQWSSTHSKPQGNRKPLHCSYCEGTTHIVDRCYFLNGFPVGHKLHGKEVQPPNRSRKTAAHQASAEIISASHKPSIEPTPQFTSEELAQIKAFFNGKQSAQANYTGISVPFCSSFTAQKPALSHWIIDSGATNHIATSVSITSPLSSQVTLPNGACSAITGIGPNFEEDDCVLEPTSYAQAVLDPKWQEAMQRELDALTTQKTWSLVPLPTGGRDSVALSRTLNERKSERKKESLAGFERGMKGTTLLYTDWGMGLYDGSTLCPIALLFMLDGSCLGLCCNMDGCNSPLWRNPGATKSTGYGGTEFRWDRIQEWREEWEN